MTKIKYTVKAMPYLKNAGEEIEGTIEINLESIISDIVKDRIQRHHPGFGVVTWDVDEEEG